MKRFSSVLKIIKNFFERFFECNYGTPTFPMDRWFGTFRDKLKENNTTYNGGSEEKICGLW